MTLTISFLASLRDTAAKYIINATRNNQLEAKTGVVITNNNRFKDLSMVPSKLNRNRLHK